VPFDTTYNFFSSDNSLPVTVTIPGGDKNIVINLSTDEAPITFNNYREIAARSKKIPVHPPKSETYFGLNPFLVVLLIVAMSLPVGLLWGNYVSPLFQKLVDDKKRISTPEVIVIAVVIVSIFLFFSGYYDFGFMALLVSFFIIGEFKNEILYPGRIKNNVEESLSSQSSISTANKPLLKYDGKDLNFTVAEIDTALNKRFPYYVAISTTDKERFIHRVKNFIADKVFYIHDESGYKEMPILISAAAIQLTFGLKKYLLPYFKNIHIYPEEFFRSNNMGICFLEGNVSGNNINLSWKHFLRGYEKSSDGQNVGLHELAHALYYQTFVVGQNVDESFRDSYDSFINHGNKAYHTEKTVAVGLYSEYAVTHFQEFWAESAEIYFERPALLKELYPSLYEAMKDLLKQDLLNESGLPVS
jgi:MtfA peptidase